MPCHLFVLPYIIDGKHKTIIEIVATGISTINEELILKSSLDVGILKGERAADNPVTIAIFMKLAPIIFPIDKLLLPFNIAVIAVENSGSDVPNAIIVIPITDSGTLYILAILIPFSTNIFDEIAIIIAEIIIVKTESISFFKLLLLETELLVLSIILLLAILLSLLFLLYLIIYATYSVKNSIKTMPDSLLNDLKQYAKII